jgi:hypothetical protein
MTSVTRTTLGDKLIKKILRHLRACKIDSFSQWPVL